MLMELYIFSGHSKSYIFNSCHVFNKVKKSTNQDEERFENAQTFQVLVTNSTACGTAITHALNRNIYQAPNHVANYNEYYFMQNVPNISPKSLFDSIECVYLVNFSASNAYFCPTTTTPLYTRTLDRSKK